MNLIDFVTNAVDIETEDRQIAVQSSAQIFRNWDLHPSMSTTRTHHNATVQDVIAYFVLAQIAQRERDISMPKGSLKEHSETVSGTSERTRLDESSPSHIPELESLKAKVSKEFNECALRPPAQRSERYSYYLLRMTKLQKRLLNVNRCLYFLDSHPSDN